MRKTSNGLFIMSLLSSTFLLSSNVFAGNGAITITGTQNNDYIASDKVTGTSFDTFTANSSSAAFRQSLIANKDKEIKDSIINFSGNSVNKDIVGLERGYAGKTTKSNTINISGGTINGSVLATSDKNNYSGSDRRDSNNINFSAGKIGGNIEGGAGATNNIITITGGTLEKDDDSCEDCGDVTGSCKSGTIYAGVADNKTKNQSTNGTVILKNMSNTNSFLSTFTDGPDELSGMILGSNLTGTSNMNFENVKGTYKGGFKNFDNLLVDANSNLILGGNAYYADNWNVNGTLNTNGKTAHAYKNITLNLGVSNTGSLTQQFLSDANINATNAGTIRGIKTLDKDITVNNNQQMTGDYEGKNVIINNNVTGVINGSTNLTSSNTSSTSRLNNSGSITGNLGVTGNFTINNQTGGKISATNITNNQNILNINNSGTMDGNNKIINADDNKTTNLNNLTGGVITGGLNGKDGILNLNNTNGTINNLSLTADSSTVNISNSKIISGVNTIAQTNNGIINLVNNATGDLTGTLNVNSGLSEFTNNGSMYNLGLNNAQTVLNITNNGVIQGNNNRFNNTALNVINLTNKNNGILLGTIYQKNGTLNIKNNDNAKIRDATFSSDNASINITNNNIMNGANYFAAMNGGTIKLENGATGDLSGSLRTSSGLSNFSNAGNLHDLSIENSIAGLNLVNTGNIYGNNAIRNASNTAFAITNKSAGVIYGIMNDNSGALNIKNEAGGKIKDLGMIVSDSGTVFTVENSGSIEGNNYGNVTNANGKIIINNNSGGTFTGIFTNVKGTEINNKTGGNIHDLIYNNFQNNALLNNAGNISNFTLNNADFNKYMAMNNQVDGKITDAINVNYGKLFLNNAGSIKGMNLTADNVAQVIIDNTKLIDGTNSFKAINDSTINISNLVGGTITGNAKMLGNTNIANAGTINNLTIENEQHIFNLSSSGIISGDNIFTNKDATNIINFTNSSTTALEGSLTLNKGNMYLENGPSSIIKNYTMNANSGGLYVTNNNLIEGENIVNAEGLDANIMINNNTNGIITGNITNTGDLFNLNNNDGGTFKNLNIVSEKGVVNILNVAKIEGNNTINGKNDSNISLTNWFGGNITGVLNVLGGVNNFQNLGSITNLALNNEQDNLIIKNIGSISGNNGFINKDNDDSIVINNSNGVINGQIVIGDITGKLTSENGTFTINNQGTIHDLEYLNNNATAAINNSGIMSGNNSITNNSGTFTLTNQLNGLLSGDLNVNSIINPVVNAGTISNLNLYNTVMGTQLQLNNEKLITGSGIWTSVDVENKNEAQINNLNLTSKNGTINIDNKGMLNGNNTLNADNGTFSLTNNDKGIITGSLTVNGGLDSINNNAGGTIGGVTLTANMDDFSITNSGSISGSNTLTANHEFKIKNNGDGVVNSDLTINAPITTLEQNSSGDFLANLYGNSSTNTLNLINSTLFNSSLNGNMGTLNLTNTNSSNVLPSLILTNNGTINNNINVNNTSYTKINNNGNILAALSDFSSPNVADGDCPENTLELNNFGNINGDMSVMNNIFKLTNAASGLVTSNHIDSRDLRLTNSGRFDSDVSYLFSVRDYLEVENTGLIYGRDMVFKLIGQPEDGKDVKGFINNSGTIYSQGTTIGYDGTDIDCPTCYGKDPLIINNSGKIVAVDVATLTNPDLNSKAIFAENAVVNNSGLIGGSMHVKEYNQTAGATWVTFLNKDLTEMSTIIAEDKISIANGSVLTIHTNNDVRAFKNNQDFKLVTAKGMSKDDIDAELEKLTIHTDSPFANYQMIGENVNEGHLVFNHVAPTTYATATDLTTASHNATILGSQRMYELFVNRDVNQVQGLASGDSLNTTNKLNFMPLGGYAHQGDKDGHAGYDTSYYGGMGYFEHDFDNNFKGGLGFAYMNNSTDFNDTNESDGKIDSYRPFAYINYEMGAWRVDLAGGVAKHKVDNNRKYSFNDVGYNAQGKYDADEISGHLNIGYKFMLENDMVIQPIAGAYAAKLKTDSFDEKGTGPMNMHVASEDYNSFKSMLGVKLSKEYELENGSSLKPELHMRWYHELGDTQGGVSAFFLAQEQLFNTSGIESPKDVGDIAFRLTTKTGTSMDLFTEAYYQFGDKFYNAGGTVGMQYNF